MATPTALGETAVRTSVSGVSIQTRITAAAADYPPSLKRVATTILDDPRVVLEKTITELARSCHTSETSVVRFCRTIGFSGYAPLRLQMAAELAAETAQFGADAGYGSDIGAGDSLASAVSKISAAEVLAIQETAANLDMDALQAVIARIAAARRVLLFGVGASHLGATDLAQKLLRIGMTALDFEDAHNALPSAALLGGDDVAIGFSHSGRTREVREVLRAARAAGAFTVAITNVGSGIVTENADRVLRTAVRETTFRSGAMASRIAQLTLVDYLFVGIARESYERSVEALRRTHESVDALRDRR